jgi:medium-chain acyl-[acyl-carrier-protein] hydrolase
MNPIYLYCFPFAAGSRYSYNLLMEASPDWLKWVPMDYPGRGRRIFEPSMTILTDVVQDLKQQLLARPEAAFAFYGHSMGSLVAYMLTVELILEERPLPKHLFLSGRGGACIPEKQRRGLHLTRDEIVAEVYRMGGNLAHLFQNPRQMDRYEQVLRADIAALDTYDYEQIGIGPLPVSATIFIGDAEGYSPAQAQLWQHEFQKPIALHVMPGDHFFIFPQAAVMAEIIARTLRQNEPVSIIT